MGNGKRKADEDSFTDEKSEHKPVSNHDRPVKRTRVEMISKKTNKRKMIEDLANDQDTATVQMNLENRPSKRPRRRRIHECDGIRQEIVVSYLCIVFWFLLAQHVNSFLACRHE